MADDDKLKILEDRLTRLEAVLTQRFPGGGSTPPGGAVVVDPAPWGGGGGGWGFHSRPIPSPVVDPAPWWTGGWGRPRWPWPTPVVDPAPWPTPVVDPAPWGSFPGAANPGFSTMAFGRIGPVGDPPPFDFSTLSISQLESTLHSLNAERARLDSMEATIKQQLERVKQQKAQR
jgi:hypothetical protein